MVKIIKAVDKLKVVSGAGWLIELELACCVATSVN